jgi:hypothetical protein
MSHLRTARQDTAEQMTATDSTIINQSQTGDEHSRNTQIGVARDVHVGDHNDNSIHLYLSSQERQAILGPARHLEDSVGGMYYKLFALDAIVTSVTPFQPKDPHGISTTTVRMVDRDGRPDSFRVPGNEELPCVPNSRIIYVDARNKRNQPLVVGVLEEGSTNCKCWSLVPILAKWMYWRPLEAAGIGMFWATLFLLWYLKVHFSFYYEFDGSWNSTSLLLLLTVASPFCLMVPAEIRETTIKAKMKELAHEIFAASSDADQAD